MKVYYNGKLIMKKDQRFKDGLWTDGRKDPRIRKHKKARRFPKLGSLIKRFITLLLVLGFVGLHTADFTKKGTMIPTEDKNAPQSDMEPPSWVKEKYPDNQIKEFDGGETGDLFDKYFGSEAYLMRAICKAENRSQDPDAIHKNRDGSIDQGLCQINTSNIKYYIGENIFDPEVNVRTAKKIRDSQDWFAWTAYKNGEYKKYL